MVICEDNENLARDIESYRFTNLRIFKQDYTGVSLSEISVEKIYIKKDFFNSEL